MKRILMGIIMDGKAGGIDKYMLNFFEKVHSDEIIIDFITNKIDKDLKKFLNDNNSELYEVPSLSNPVAQYISISKLIKKNNYDTVYFNISTAISFIGPLAAKICKVKKVIIHSHTSGIDSANRKKRMIMTFINNVCKTILYKFGTNYYACSHIAGEWIFPKKISSCEKLVIINNAIDVSKFAFDNSTRLKIRNELSIETKFVIGHIGNFLYQKNHEFLIDCFYNLLKINNNAILLLIGDGPLFNPIKEKVSNLGINDKVIFVGRVQNACDYLQAMDVFAFPSNFEGLGIVAVEAQAAGLKCILSDKVPKEAELTDNCVFLAINHENSANEWADCLNMYQSYVRSDESDNISKKGYCLENQKLDDWV
ncbi:MAG: glycosyltransferase [Oscillospiraceae bacterium]